MFRHSFKVKCPVSGANTTFIFVIVQNEHESDNVIDRLRWFVSWQFGNEMWVALKCYITFENNYPKAYPKVGAP